MCSRTCSTRVPLTYGHLRLPLVRRVVLLVWLDLGKLSCKLSEEVADRYYVSVPIDIILGTTDGWIRYGIFHQLDIRKCSI